MTIKKINCISFHYNKKYHLIIVYHFLNTKRKVCITNIVVV